jgi:hypothetical protein
MDRHARNLTRTASRSTLLIPPGSPITSSDSAIRSASGSLRAEQNDGSGDHGTDQRNRLEQRDDDAEQQRVGYSEKRERGARCNADDDVVENDHLCVSAETHRHGVKG